MTRRRTRLMAAAVATVAILAAVTVLVATSGDGQDGGSEGAGGGGSSGGGGADEGRGERPPPATACTLIACSSGVTIDVAALRDGARSARVCVQRACGPARAVSSPGFLTATLPPAARRDGATVRVAVELRDSDGRRVGRVTRETGVRRTRPNGPDCPPVCYQARLRLDRRGGIPRLRPAR